MAGILGLGPLGTFITTYWDVLAFYTLVILLLYAFRKKFVFQGIVALLHTQFGVKFMTETGKRHPKLWNRVGLVAIVVGFIGMAFIVGYLFYGLYTLVAVPDAPPALSPVIPGVKIPGVPFTFPLWYTLGALFFAIIVHEAMHGILSSAFNVKIKSSGFAFLGPIPGAFVEPDEETLKKRPKRQQLAMVAGGPFANVVLAAIAFLLFIGLASLGGKLLITEGVTFQSVQEGSPAQIAGMMGNQTITAIDGIPITNLAELSAVLDTKNIGENILVTADGRQYRVTLADNDGKAYMGVLAVTTKSRLKNPDMGWVYSGVLVISTLLLWTYIISLGVGIANLLPLFMVDGGRMALIALEHFFEEETAKQIWTKGGFFILALVLILVFVPIGKAIFF